MADLKKIADLLNVKIDGAPALSKNKTPLSEKRRPWIFPDEPGSNEIATRYQPDSNQTANQKQDNGKRDSNKVAIREQLDNDKVTTRDELDNNKITIRQQLDNKTGINQCPTVTSAPQSLVPHSHQCPIVTAKTNPENRYANIEYKRLIDINCPYAQIVFVWLCMHRNTKTGLCCPSIENVSKLSYLSARTVIRSIKKLCAIGLVEIIKKPGLSNHYKINQCPTVTSAPQSLVPHSHQCPTVTSAPQSPNQCPTVTPPVTVSHSNNRNNNRNNTTTGNEGSSGVILSKEWQSVNIEPLRKYDITEKEVLILSHLPHLTPEILQESINRCAFDFENNNREATIETNAFAFFMGIMRKTIYKIPKGYERKLQQETAETRVRTLKDEDPWKHLKHYEEYNKKK